MDIEKRTNIQAERENAFEITEAALVRASTGEPPVIYDVRTDETRPISQDDIDQLLIVGSTQALLRRAIRHLDEMAGKVIRHEMPRDDFHAIMRALGIH